MGNNKRKTIKKDLKQRKKRVKIEEFSSLEIREFLVEDIAKNLARKIDKEIFRKKYAPVKDVLALVGAGVFLAGSLIVPNLPVAIKPFLLDKKEYEVWKRFNIPYLKRTLERLAKQKLVKISEEEGLQVVKITDRGRIKIIKYALDELEIEKPKFWDGQWRLVSYDIPKEKKGVARIFREYLTSWGFYPLHESVYLHAYPCEEKIEFLREYLGVGKYVRIFTVSKIENDKLFRDFFGI